MPSIDLVDESFIAASPKALAEVVHDEPRWMLWFEGMNLEVFMDRGEQGIRWSVTGRYAGSAEIWLESFGDGVIVHHYLRVDPTAKGSDTEIAPWPDTLRGRRSASKQRVALGQHWKRIVWQLKDELERGRDAGMPAVKAPSGGHRD